MRLAVLTHGSRYVLGDPTFRARAYNFSMGTSDASEHVLLHSGAATPGRYLMEMLRRTAAMTTAGGPVAAVSPLLELTPHELGLIVARLKWRLHEDTALLVQDADGRPLAYRLPPAAANGTMPYLALLTAVDAQIDERLLRACLTVPVETVVLPIALSFRHGADAFTLGAHHRAAYRWTADRAIRELEAHHGPGRSTIPFAAILPFHAGDVLFMLLALERLPGVRAAIVVDRTYRDIVRTIAPSLECIEIDLARDRSRAADWDPALCQMLVRDELPAGYVYVYCRPSRAYDGFPIHLLDQYAFACGAPTPAARVPAAPPLRAPTRRILLHVDGGWPIKVYPEAEQHALIDRLMQAGFGVTVMSARPEVSIRGCANVRFRDLAQLRALLGQHDLLIGMDSFPAHFAAHVLGVPTICLFASTQPANSDAAPGPRYRALEAGLECRPCGAVSRCPRFGGTVCRNFSAPADVVAAAREMWTALYREAA